MVYAAVKENFGWQLIGALIKRGGVHLEMTFMSAVSPLHIRWRYISTLQVSKIRRTALQHGFVSVSFSKTKKKVASPYGDTVTERDK